MFTLPISGRQDARSTTRRPRARRSPMVESLEGRQLLSALPPAGIKHVVLAPALIRKFSPVDHIQGQHIGLRVAQIQGQHIGTGVAQIVGAHIGTGVAQIVGAHIGSI